MGSVQAPDEQICGCPVKPANVADNIEHGMEEAAPTLPEHGSTITGSSEVVERPAHIPPGAKHKIAREKSRYILEEVVDIISGRKSKWPPRQSQRASPVAYRNTRLRPSPSMIGAALTSDTPSPDPEKMLAIPPAVFYQEPRIYQTYVDDKEVLISFLSVH